MPITLDVKIDVAARGAGGHRPQDGEGTDRAGQGRARQAQLGAGTITAQLMGVPFHKAAGLDIVYVPFKGTAETVNGLMNGSVELIYGATVTVAR